MNSVGKTLLTLLAILGVLCIPATARAEPGDELTISLLTMSPGDPVFFKFGHNAIWVHDARTGRDDVYNWGTFSFEEEGLVIKFLRGRLTYWLSVQSIRGTERQYASENRSVLSQELDLTRQQKLRLVLAMRQNAMPANATYRYHYYRDNCSTRVRDMLDQATAGALRSVSTEPAPLTYRGETSRLTADVLWAFTFLNTAMGSFIDQPITLWDGMFVPERVTQAVRKATNRNEQGKLVPLVKAERMLVSAQREPPPEQPPNRLLGYLLTGSLLGALFGWLSFRLLSWSGTSKAPLRLRLALGLPLGAITTATAFFGLLFLFFWTLTDHEVAYHNENLLQTNPLSVVMPVIAIGLLRGCPWAKRSFCWAAWGLALLSIMGLLLKAMPWWFKQVNGSTIALWLPFWLGLALGAWKASVGAAGLRARRGAPGGARLRTT